MPIRLDEESNTWYFRFSYKKRSYYRGGFKFKTQAAEAEATKLRLVKQHPELPDEDLKFSDAVQWFFENHSVKRKSSWKNDRARIKIMCEFFGDKMFDEISVLDIASLREYLLSRGLKAHTVNHYQALLRAIYNRLKKFGLYWGDNPATKVDMEKIPKARTRFLYPSEEKLLTPMVKENIRLWPYYFVALHTGMRISEICNIRVKDVCISMGTIFVPNSKPKRSRYVPISNELSDFLQLLISSKKAEGFALAGLSPQWVQRSLKKVCEKADINDLKFHDLRHTFAQRLLSKGVPIYKVAKILGHSNVKVTEDHYGHLAMSDLKSAVDNIDGVVSMSDSQNDGNIDTGCIRLQSTATKSNSEPIKSY